MNFKRPFKFSHFLRSAIDSASTFPLAAYALVVFLLSHFTGFSRSAWYPRRLLSITAEYFVPALSTRDTGFHLLFDSASDIFTHILVGKNGQFHVGTYAFGE
jgi:hypothetical protein